MISTKYKSSSSWISSKTNFEVFWKNIERLKKVRNFKREGGRVRRFKSAIADLGILKAPISFLFFEFDI